MRFYRTATGRVAGAVMEGNAAKNGIQYSMLHRNIEMR
jgi:hypothetical protein